MDSIDQFSGRDENAFIEGRPTADGWHEGKMADKSDENAFTGFLIAVRLKLLMRYKNKWYIANKKILKQCTKIVKNWII